MDIVVPLIGLVILAGLFPKGRDSVKGPSNCYNQFTYIKQVGGAPFAKGSCSAIWPVITSNSRKLEVPYLDGGGNYVNGNPARAFGSIRGNGARYHVGIDLYCNDQDICVACEDGKIVGIQGFLNITKAVLLQTNSGIVCLYGEVEDGSWNEFNIKKGSVVRKGQPICRIGKNNAGTQMLHFETYIRGTTKNSTWNTGENPPSQILNPTKYLLNISTKYENKTS